MVFACRLVVENGGNPGIDGMKAEDLWKWLQRNHDKLAKSLLEGRYRKGKNAELAVLQAQRHMQEGKRWVVAASS